LRNISSYKHDAEEVLVSGNISKIYDTSSNSFRILNMTNVTFLLQPVSPCTSHLVLMVLSAPGNVEKRNRMRRQLNGKINVKIIFLLGFVASASDQELLSSESNLHDDLVQGSVPDSYDTLSYKTLTGFTWANVFCGDNTKYVAKTDDDVTLDMEHIIAVLNEKYGEDPPDILECPSVIKNMRPLQHRHNGTIMTKFFVSREELNRRVYPDLCFGWLYVTTPRVGLALTEVAVLQAEKLVSRADRDDYFITGFLRERLPWVRLRQLEGGWYGMLWDNILSSCTFMGISKNIFFNSFVVAKGSGSVQYVQGYRLYSCIVWEFYVLGAVEYLAPRTVVRWVGSFNICVR